MDPSSKGIGICELILLEDRQAHGGTALTTSPKVVYTYAYGTGGKFLRRTGMTYPDTTFGSAVKPAYDFGTAGGANDVLNRVGRIYQSFPAREFADSVGFRGKENEARSVSGGSFTRCGRATR